MKKNIIISCLMCGLGFVTYMGSCLYGGRQVEPVHAEYTEEIITDEYDDEKRNNSSFSYVENREKEADADEDVWTPSPDDLNLAHFFPEGADRNDSTASYAAMAFQELMNIENSWWVNVYSYSDLTPRELASQLGRSEDSVIGRYDSSDKSQDPDDASTWEIRNFSKTRINITNGDGNHRNLQSNIIDIMSMANVYTYYHDIEDYDLFFSYAKGLLSQSHSYTLSMSDVYYCEGECMAHNGEEEAEEEADDDDRAETDIVTIHNHYATPSDSSESQNHRSSVDSTTMDSTTMDSTTMDSAVMENSSSESEGHTVVVAGTSAQGSSDSAVSGNTGSENTVSGNTASENIDSQDTDSHDLTIRSAATSSNAEKTCPGHIDLTINIKIYGIEETNGLFERDPIGNTVDEEDSSQWRGWGEEERSYVKSLSGKDWYENYGLTLSTFSLGNPLTQSEIQEYLNQLPSGLSAERRAVVEFALSSVGKVPYYWGGKASRAGYEGNNFGLLVESDSEGRVFKGLDCSGWISWVYWSAIGERLPYESTAGLVSLGKSISKYEMQPGDIALRTGDNAHVIMFLGWTDDGRILCVHESSDGVNNVTVAIKNDNWTNYRNILD